MGVLKLEAPVNFQTLFSATSIKNWKKQSGHKRLHSITSHTTTGSEMKQFVISGPYSLLVRASYFISCSVHARFDSVLSIDCKWRWGCRHF